ncbi:probable apyrase 6 isoform X1 [Arachis stenosperma]|uniref:probable apyrase 6 isoform X1 n=1 Tax=Arachis stenosperma TaxID=217475 RepID=UPI0025AD9202|nr:probable apyrase 6 isoform X1 [Arachis stenosperma]
MRRSNARNRVASNSNSDNNSKKMMDPAMKLQLRSATTTTTSSPSRPSLFPRHIPKPSTTTTSKSRFACIATLLLTLLLLLTYKIISSKSSPSSSYSSSHQRVRYGIILDGGSTGTRIHVLRSGGGGGIKERELLDLGSMRVNPGLSSFAKDPEGAGRSISELVEFGKGKVPREKWAHTEIRLMATAGMRLLGPEAQGRILEACRRVLRSSGFKFRDDWASVITGSDEGIYAWVVANYALGTLGGDPLDTTGIIELGGASAQVTFVSRELTQSGSSHIVKFGNTTYNLYSHSFLHYGLNVAHDSWREALVSKDFNMASQSLQEGLRIDPCTPTGYLHNVESWKFSPSSGSDQSQYQPTVQTKGNFSECRSAALMLLQRGKDKCTHQHCDLGSNFIPHLQGRFLATENFFHTSKFFGLGSKAYLSELMSAGQNYCGEDWLRLKKKYISHDEEDLLRYCFSSAYIVAMLHDSLGIALNDERIKVANKVGDIPLDWALGAFILQTTTATDADVQNNHSWGAATIFSDESPTLLSVIGIFIILLLTAWSISRWRKPQLKTIYDLEKGRYIITRVGR